MEDKNILKLVGLVKDSQLAFTGKKFGEKFYTVHLDVVRKSDAVDTVPVIISEKLLYDITFSEGTIIRVEGKLRSRNFQGEDGKSHLLIYGYAHDCEEVAEEEYLKMEERNVVELTGFICREPRTRQTPGSNRMITDTMIAVNRQPKDSSYRAYSDYVPCIAWGRNARMASKREMGDHVSLVGRFQSRQYHRRDSKDKFIAYEVSIGDITVIE